MICFCDKEVYSIYETEVDRSTLFRHFIKKENLDSVILVYNDDEQFVGIVTYNTLLYAEDKTKADVIKHKVYASDKIFDEAEKIFLENTPIDVIPVLNNDNEIINFCYKSIEGPEFSSYDDALSEIEKGNCPYFIQDLYPSIQAVYIYDMNEWAYRFYKALINMKFPVVVKGSRWKEVFNIDEGEDICPDFARLNIYAEGNKMVMPFSKKKNYYHEDSFELIKEIGNLNHLYEDIKWKKYFNTQGIEYIICRGLEKEDIDFYSSSEIFRQRYTIFPSFIGNKKDKSLIATELEKVCGIKYNEFELKKKEESSKINNSIIAFSKGVINCNTYGNGNNTIYLIAPPCIAYNIGSLYEESIQYKILKRINEKMGNCYKLVCITIYDQAYGIFDDVLSNLKPNKKDIIITMSRYSNNVVNVDNLVNEVDYDIKQFLEKRDLSKDYFYDQPIHLNWRGNEIVANDLYNKFIEPHLEKIKDIKVETNELLTDIEKAELDKYLKSIESYKHIGSNNGAIVMNCNPFTNGHLYLIEEAAKKVDYLYIFVVEEDKSFFKFNDRIKLVKEGIKYLDNVIVIPSGKYILSYTTLPTYFEKATKQEEVIDASLDVNIFGKYIAPFMDIRIRFVGEEPLDKVTRQYNQEMSKILQEYNVGFVEIKRKEFAGQAISASRVRKLMEEDKLSQVKDIVPETTFNFIENNIHNLLTN